MASASPPAVSLNSYDPPICLYGSALVGPGTEGEVPTGAISNNTGRPIEVREIRFSADSTDTSTVESNLAGVLRAMVTIGGKPVMGGPIPLWSLGRLENVSAQNFRTAANAPLATQYTWRLARPCILPPRCAVTVKFTHPGTVNFAVTGRVGLLGRFTDRSTRISAVPYALAWQSKNVGLAVDADVSDERGMANTLGKTIQIARIVARHAILCSGTPTDPADATLSFYDGRVNRAGSVAATMSLLRLKLATSRNWPILPDYMPIWDVFGVPGSIEIPHTLPVGDFYKAMVKYYIADAESGIAPTWPGGTPVTFQHALHLSFLGWREEAL